MKGPSTADLAIYRTADLAIAKEADRMCAERCARAAGGKPYRGCNAVAHGWRDDAIASLKAAARLSEAQAGQLAEIDVATITMPEPGPGEAVFLIRVGRSQSQMRTKAKGIEPQRAVELAIAVLTAEGVDAEACPYHGGVSA